MQPLYITEPQHQYYIGYTTNKDTVYIIKNKMLECFNNFRLS